MSRILSMVMWTGKAATFMAGLAVALSVALAVAAGTAEAAKTKSLQAGVNNAVKATTSVVGTVAGPILRLDNNGAGAALDLQVEAGNAPMTVNSDGKVTNLNADKLDGLDANGLNRVAFGQRVGIVVGGQDATMTSEEITAPADGFLVISASSNGRNTNARDAVGCEIRVDGETITASRRFIEMNGDQNVNEDETCATNVVKPVTAGIHEVDFEATGINSTSTVFTNPSLWVIFVPFDGEGDRPVQGP